MIDYDKLKIAYELASSSHKWMCIETKYNIHEPRLGFKLTALVEPPKSSIFYFNDIDELIMKIKELTANPKAKYKVGDEVYIVGVNGKRMKAVIDDIDHDPREKYFINEEKWYTEDEIFSSKIDLIKSQIKYWNDMLSICDEEARRCEHESDSA